LFGSFDAMQFPLFHMPGNSASAASLNFTMRVPLRKRRHPRLRRIAMRNDSYTKNQFEHDQAGEDIMKWFYNLKIANKLILSFVLVLLFSVALGGFAIYQLARVNQAAVELKSVWLPSMREILEIKANIARMRSVELQYGTVSPNADMAHYEKSINALTSELRGRQEKYARFAVQPAEQQAFDRFKSRWEAHMTQIGRSFAAIKEQKDWEVAEILRDEAIVSSRKQLDDTVSELIALNEAGSAEAGAQGDASYLRSRIWIAGFLFASVALGLGLALWIARIVSRPLKSAVGISRKVADGDLTTSVEVRSTDETGELMQALKDMNISLSRIVAGVRASTDTIATASSQIASGNMDLSSRTEEQAGTLEQTAASMNDLTLTVKRNADNAQKANQLAESASNVALKGSAVVSEVIETMNLIDQSAKKIVDIIGVIDGIAFQTNILALNAAVEAARAGEQGRGFAVVASEVRSLAQRSSAAAKEIKILIGDSVEKVGMGARLVGQAGTTMDEVVLSAQKTAGIIGEITAVTQGQEQDIEKVNQAIGQLEKVTQQNAALVEEAAAAAQSLHDQVENLASSVNVFQLDETRTALAD
jgi:methyl-accepting chemotaxis protein